MSIETFPNSEKIDLSGLSMLLNKLLSSRLSALLGTHYQALQQLPICEWLSYIDGIIEGAPDFALDNKLSI